MLSTTLLLGSVAILAIYLIVRFADQEVGTRSVWRETFKRYLLSAQQILGLIAGLGLAASVPWLGTLSEALEFISVNFDSTADHVKAILTVLTAFFALFRKDVVAQNLQAYYSGGVGAKSVGDLRL